jgi:type II secretory pathway pseudopilin PulG
MATDRQRRAFTLMEMVVAMAIVIALCVIAFPVFSRARENSHRAVCKSNLHQLYLAVSLYRQDYDGMDPQKGLSLSHSQLGLPHAYSMGDFYQHYVKSKAILFCPSATVDRPDMASTYLWGMIESEFTDPSRDYEGIAALRGPDYPLALCESHNGPALSKAAQSSKEVQYYHVLRIDGRVDVRKCTPSEQGSAGIDYW